MSLRHSLLGLLAEEPRTGYELTRLFDESLLNVWPTSHSQIYPELSKLAADGLIRQTASGSRGKKVYAITPAGMDEVRAWLRTEPDHFTRNPSFLRVFFLWLMEPEDAIAFLEREELEHEAKLREFEAKAELRVRDTSREWAFRLALDWGVRYEREMLEWNAWARREIEGRGKLAGSARARR
ncbi:MAG: PadR family transcriptional regulator [Actinomycetota bacterium]